MSTQKQKNKPPYHLVEGILKLSEASLWAEAKLEWELDEVHETDRFETCLCTHYPIKELCFLRNIKNGNSTMVGNCCVKQFLGLPSHAIFSAIRRITEDAGRALNPKALAYAHRRGWITEWERKFYLDTWRKNRGLTQRQWAVRMRINLRFLRLMRSDQLRRTRPIPPKKGTLLA